MTPFNIDIDSADDGERLEFLLTAIGSMPHRWAGLKFAFDAVMDQGPSRGDWDELITFVNEVFDVTDERMQTIDALVNAISRARAQHRKSEAADFADLVDQLGGTA